MAKRMKSVEAGRKELLKVRREKREREWEKWVGSASTRVFTATKPAVTVPGAKPTHAEL